MPKFKEVRPIVQAIVTMFTSGASGFRCVPVLDESGKLFRGNIYKMHIYRHKSRGGDMQLPVTQLLKNATKFISINSAFFNIFFTIKDLPYITVLDEGVTGYQLVCTRKIFKWRQLFKNVP